jgi:hypothetical protein
MVLIQLSYMNVGTDLAYHVNMTLNLAPGAQFVKVDDAEVSTVLSTAQDSSGNPYQVVTIITNDDMSPGKNGSYFMVTFCNRYSLCCPSFCERNQ